MPRHKKFDSDEESDVDQERNESEDEADEEDENEDDDLLAESDSDAAPEDVSFSAGRTAALDKIKDTMKQMEGEKAKLKEKRRKQQEIHMLQKKQKLDALSRKRLPDDLLQNLSSGPVVQKRKKGVKRDKKTLKEDSERELNERLIEATESDEEETEKNDYISLNSGSDNFEVVSLKHDLKKMKKASQTAAEFKQTYLYGDRIRRESVQAQIAKGVKREARLK